MHRPARAWFLTFSTMLAACASSAPESSGTYELFASWPSGTTWDAPSLRTTTEVWIESLDGARRSLDLAFFYWSDDPAADGTSRLTPVIDAVERAAARGVSVRALGDEGFADTYPDVLARLDAVDGIDVRTYALPEGWDGVHHAKYFVVDGRRVVTGSQNFDWRSLEHIQELGVRLDSPECAEAYSRLFEMDWALAGGAEPDQVPRTELAPRFPVTLEALDAGLARATPVVSPRGLLPDEELWDLPLWLAWIDGAQEEIRLQALSYDPVDRDGARFVELEDALVRATERGVAVRLAIADWNKRPGRVEELQALAARPGFEVRFVVVPDDPAGFVPFSRVVHAKLLVVDRERVWIGSSNVSRDYFEASRNAGVALEGRGVGALAAELHEAVFASSYAEPVVPGERYEPRRYRD